MNDATLNSMRAKDVIGYIHAITSALCFSDGHASFFFFHLKEQKREKLNIRRKSGPHGSVKKKQPHIHSRPTLYHITPLPNRSDHESSSAAIPTETKNGSKATQ